MNGIDRLIAWFPSKWQARYGTEIRDLLRAQPITWPVYRDLLFACVDAWAREAVSAVRRVGPLVWALMVVGAVVGAIATVGWMIAAGVHQATAQLGFASWLQAHLVEALSGRVTENRRMLWLAMYWFAFGWRWQIKSKAPGLMTHVCLLAVFSALLALDQSGPNFSDGLGFGILVCSPFTPRLQAFVAWASGHAPSSARPAASE